MRDVLDSSSCSEDWSCVYKSNGHRLICTNVPVNKAWNLGPTFHGENPNNYYSHAQTYPLAQGWAKPGLWDGSSLPGRSIQPSKKQLLPACGCCSKSQWGFQRLHTTGLGRPCASTSMGLLLLYLGAPYGGTKSSGMCYSAYILAIIVAIHTLPCL